MHKTTRFLILPLVLAAAAAPTVADAAVCSSPNMISAVKTFVDQAVPCPDLRADVNGTGCVIKWQGWLYRPTGAVNNRPAIIYLHGHGDQSSPKAEPCEMAKFFTGQGFVFFAPLQRGYMANQTDFPGMRSSGTHIDSAPSPFTAITYLEAEADDVRSAISWLKTQQGPGICQIGQFCPMVDPARIAIMGHSFGGSLTVFANALSPALGHAAAVDISGAVLSWDKDSSWRLHLEHAIDGAQQPIYIFQNKNEGSLEPTADLSAYGFRIPHRQQGAMFHNVPTTPSPPYTGDAHVDFVTVADEVALWGPSVVTFLDTYLP